ncbi:MAG: endo-1,4-beta-xylanase, partial [Candidatus Brocadia sp.]
MIWDKERGWRKITIGNISTKINMNSGTLLGGYGFADYYNDLIRIQREHFNSGMVTPDMRTGFLGPNNFRYTYIDSDVRLGSKNNMPMIAHLLVWPSVVPDWLVNGNYNREQIMSFMTEWIKTTMKRYPQIKIWEVVNEAYDNDFFQKTLGNDYIVEFYRIAREARPDALLIYNDYANHSLVDRNFPNGNRTQHTQQIIRRLQEENLIDGVGVQMILYA